MPRSWRSAVTELYTRNASLQPPNDGPQLVQAHSLPERGATFISAECTRRRPHCKAPRQRMSPTAAPLAGSGMSRHTLRGKQHNSLKKSSKFKEASWRPQCGTITKTSLHCQKGSPSLGATCCGAADDNGVPLRSRQLPSFHNEPLGIQSFCSSCPAPRLLAGVACHLLRFSVMARFRTAVVHHCFHLCQRHQQNARIQDSLSSSIIPSHCLPTLSVCFVQDLRHRCQRARSRCSPPNGLPCRQLRGTFSISNLVSSKCHPISLLLKTTVCPIVPRTEH